MNDANIELQKRIARPFLRKSDRFNFITNKALIGKILSRKVKKHLYFFA